MFFPRLRRQVKWMFVFLALAFAVGFVVFNVGGAGPSGGIGDLLRDAGGPGGPSEGDARDKIEENPNDPEGYRELATALQNKGELDEAIPALRRYVELKPGDTDAQRQLATLYIQKADRFRDEAQLAQAEAQGVIVPSTFGPPAESQLARALGTNPLSDAVTQLTNERLNTAYTQMQENYRAAVSVYKRLAKRQPNESDIQLELATTAETAGDTATALAAYKRYVKLAPEDPNAPEIRARIKQLQQPSSISAPAG